METMDEQVRREIDMEADHKLDEKGTARRKPGSKRSTPKLNPITTTLASAIAGSLNVRVSTSELTGDAAETGELINQLLDRLGAQIEHADARKQITTQEID